MYFNPAFRRGRASARAAPSRSEDSQPNESINKRTQNPPPIVVATRPSTSSWKNRDEHGLNAGFARVAQGPRARGHSFNHSQTTQRSERRRRPQPQTGITAVSRTAGRPRQSSVPPSLGAPHPVAPAPHPPLGYTSFSQPPSQPSVPHLPLLPTETLVPPILNPQSMPPTSHQLHSCSSLGLGPVKPCLIDSFPCAGLRDPSGNTIDSSLVVPCHGFDTPATRQISPPFSSVDILPPSERLSSDKESGTGSSLIGNPSISVKRECRSPPPSSPSLPSRRLVSSGCRRYAPVPPECDKKKNIDFRTHRRTWAQKMEGELVAKGLKKTKLFFRDDGMIIEWESPVPVWSDTLLPDNRSLGFSGSTHTLNVVGLPNHDNKAIAPSISSSSHYSAPTFATNCSRWDEPSAPSLFQASSTRSAKRRRHQSAATTASDVLVIGELDDDKAIGPQMKPIPQSKFVPDATSRSPILTFKHDFTALEEQYESIAVQFIKRYMSLFDADRSALVHAYAQDGIFSCRRHTFLGTPLSASARRFIPIDLDRSNNSAGSLYQSPALITSILCRLGHHRLSHADLTYDMLYQPHDGSILISCYGTAVDLDDTATDELAINQSFILRRKEPPKDVIQNAEKWPFVIISHQMACLPR